MGNSLFYIYGRDKDRYWLSEPIHESEKQSLGRFKHCVYSFALRERFENCQSIYYYQGRYRLIKATMEDNTLVLSFNNVEALRAFEDAEESLHDFKKSFMERQFSNRFTLNKYKEMTSYGILTVTYNKC